MLEFKQWRCFSSEQDNGFLAKGVEYDTAIVGRELSLDDRSNWVGTYVSKISKRVDVVQYDKNTDIFKINDNEEFIASLDKLSIDDELILIDSTSLEVPEMLYTMLWLKEHKKCFDILYVEPSDYNHTETNSGDFFKRKYSLSNDGPGINLLSRFLCPTSNSHIIISLGFEGHRFGSILQSDEFIHCKVSGLVGVPPFNAGWERRTYAENASQMGDAIDQRTADFFVAGANDPIKNYEILKEIYNADCEIGDTDKPAIHLAPFGTKPVALAMILFAINNNHIGIVYDFLRKKDKGSQGKGKVHLWRVGYAL